ncbi:hypothetical protein [Effusibacillus dendaii]|uniref:Uncharacterized protein n=1 Tax=Effusibacillus dendaii TaxID=2743772 RepID=A0A7I8DBE9_9BACL|nr:hypothetical protein [Effusibacillus dendaii]BCJ87513.1 hypothetical protein skT53_24980 [Effusibacillus dendaii]
MGKFLTTMYLVIAFYCIVSAFLAAQVHEYQHTMLSFFLAVFNLAIFAIFRKDSKRPKLKLILGSKQKEVLSIKQKQAITRG